MKKFAITVLAIAIALLFLLAMIKNAQQVREEQAPEPTTAQTEPTQPAQQPVQPATPDTAAQPAAPAAAQAPATPAPAAPAGPRIDLTGLKAAPADNPSPARLGGDADTADAYKLVVDLHHYGAAIHRIALTDYRVEAMGDPNEHYVVSDVLEVDHGRVARLYPFAARSVTIDGQQVDLQAVRWNLVSASRDAAVYSVTIVNAADQPVLEIRRRYQIEPDNYDMRIDQQLINRTTGPLQVTWSQNLQGDVTNDTSYMGDRRIVATGYYSPSYDRERRYVYTDDAFISRLEVLKKLSKTAPEQQLVASDRLWPQEDVPPDAELVWVAMINRYFGMVVHQPLTETGSLRNLESLLPDVNVEAIGQGPMAQRQIMLTASSAPLTIAPEGHANLNLGLFAGPRDPSLFREGRYARMGFDKLIVYELGCAICTFQPLAKGLLGFLRFLHDHIVFDWGVAIIVLVLVVRLILHPITKRSQVNMMKMGKQMQALQPEMEKIKKKYANDSTKMNQEVMNLYREKGVNPANMLGCLPMLLQTPIWVALYAMLYFAIELRHQPAFYGVFQAISGGSWAFLADLSSPDQFIKFSRSFNLNLWFIHLEFSAINVLPLLWAVVMYFNQKLTQPPPANDQAAQQQKIMQWMSVLFPFFLYSAPSGLTLYTLASTAAGIVDSYVVRRHVKQQEESGELFKAKPRKPGGFMDRLMTGMQQAMEQAQKQQDRGGQQPPKRRK